MLNFDVGWVRMVVKYDKICKVGCRTSEAEMEYLFQGKMYILNCIAQTLGRNDYQTVLECLSLNIQLIPNVSAVKSKCLSVVAINLRQNEFRSVVAILVYDK